MLTTCSQCAGSGSLLCGSLWACLCRPLGLYCHNVKKALICKRFLRAFRGRFFLLALLPVAALLLFALSSSAQEVSVDEALDLFLKNNWDVLINRYEIDKAQGDLIQARLFPNPNVSVNYTGMTSGGSRTDATQQTYRLDQLIELGGKRKYRIGTATEALEAVKLAHKDAIRSLLVGFYTTYYNLLLSQLNIDFQKEDLQKFDRVFQIAEKRHLAGFLTLIEYTKLKLARIDLENGLTATSNQLRNDIESFSLLLGGNIRIQPGQSQVTEEFPEYSENEVLERAYISRWDLLALERQSKSFDYSYRLAKAQRIPDITIGGEYEGFGKNLEPGRGLGVSLNIPIFARNQGEIARRSAEYSQIKLQIERTKRQIEVDVKHALNNYRSGLTIFDAYKTRKNEMLELLGRSEKAFSLGGITVLDLLDTQRTYRDFMTKYRQSLVQSALNQALIRVSTGEIK